MVQIRELVKRNMPFARDLIISVRDRLSAPPLEDIVLHDYAVVADPDPRKRLSLVISSIAPHKAFGGVATGIDIFLELGKRTGADLRIIIDDFEPALDRSVLDKRAQGLGLDPAAVDVIRRDAQNPQIGVRSADVFVTYNSWMTLNIRPVVREQCRLFGRPEVPLLYLIQDYEPQFYPFSSTHMMSRAAFDPTAPCWAIINSAELDDYVQRQGHVFDRRYLFQPQLALSLRPALAKAPLPKAKRILVYGRPTIPRNCFPAIEKGLALWVQTHPEFAEWEIVSAGWPHKPIELGHGRVMRSLGKLSLEDYGQLLLSTGVGLSLMASPHPSYPPLEMAHFGITTITNRYAGKDLGVSHDNISSIGNIGAITVSDALARACLKFEHDSQAGWKGRSHIPGFLSVDAFPFLDDLCSDLFQFVWE